MNTTYITQNYLSIGLNLYLLLEAQNKSIEDLTVDIVSRNTYVILKDDKGYLLVYVDCNQLRSRHFILANDTHGLYIINGSGQKYRSLINFVNNSIC